ALAVDGRGNATISEAGEQRFFALNSDGSYQAPAGDTGQLTLSGGVYQLRERDNTTLTFNAQGNIASFDDGKGHRVTAGYTNGLLTSLTASDGEEIHLSYTPAGRAQQVTGPGTQVTTYTYDATGQYLLSVAGPQGTTSYTYVTGQSIAQNNALA